MDRESIIQKSIAEFQKHGVRKMTLQQLAGKLGISTKTVYKHFADKETLLTSCLEVHYALLYDRLIQDISSDESPVLKLFRIWIGALTLDFGTSHLFYEDLNYYYPAAQDRILKKYREKFSGPVLRVMDEGMDKGLFREELVPAVVLEASGAIYRLLTRTTQFKRFRLDPFRLAENTIGVYLRGLCTVKGLQELKSIHFPESFINS